MKKNVTIMSLAVVIFITIVLAVNIARADYFDSPLVNVWNSRKDLQKAFPGDPSSNPKLDAWCKKYGWKEDTSLSSCSPNTASTITIDSKYEERIAALESKINELNNKVAQLSSNSNAQSVSAPVISGNIGKLRKCSITGSGSSNMVSCERLDTDYAYAYGSKGELLTGTLGNWPHTNPPGPSTLEFYIRTE